MSERDETRLLSATEVTGRLGVKPATLYAYVSRGLLPRRRRAGARGSWFDPADVDRLASRARRAPARERRELRIQSAVTAIEDGRYFFRGHDPLALARTAGFERTAELLWTGTLPADAPVWTADAHGVAVGRAVLRALPEPLLPFDAARLVVAALAGTNPFRHDLRPEAVVEMTRHLLATLAEVLPAPGRAPRPRAPASFAARLWRLLSARPPTVAQVQTLDAALVLLADHELAGSTFAVRIAAGLRADPYGAVGAGLGVLGGAWHGAASIAVETVLREIEAGGAARAVGARLARGERLPGLGHPLYPDGDPRAPALLGLVRAAAPRSPRLRAVDAYLAAGRARRFPPPNVDTALGALSHVFELPPATGELLFAMARIAGWVAHAIEEYAAPSSLRVRALYTGVRPPSAG